VQASSTATRRFTLPAATQASFNWSTTFNSASELAAALLRLGKDFNVLQLSPGRLHGHFSVVHLTDQRVVLHRPVSQCAAGLETIDIGKLRPSPEPHLNN